MMDLPALPERDDGSKNHHDASNRVHTLLISVALLMGRFEEYKLQLKGTGLSRRYRLQLEELGPQLEGYRLQLEGLGPQLEGYGLQLKGTGFSPYISPANQGGLYRLRKNPLI
jgi:hypothetical protein